MSENELPASRLSKVIVGQTDRQIDRQRDGRPLNYVPRRFAGGQKFPILATALDRNKSWYIKTYSLM